jgi:exodeoxyribonuclease V beta subunit
VAYVAQNYGRQEIALKKEKGVEEFDFSAVDTGLALHYALEMLQAFDPGSIEDAMTAVENRFVLPEETLQRVRDMVACTIGDADFKSLIQGEVFKERSFILNGEMGVIDLYVVEGDDIRIIDYKTGGQRAGYTEQIARYKEALGQLYPGKKISGYLCYISEAALRIEPVA